MKKLLYDIYEWSLVAGYVVGILYIIKLFVESNL